jgi:ketosteroid isomerase-like protein
MHPNEQLIRDAYDAVARRDGATLAALLTPTTRWIVRGHGGLAGTYVGPDEIFEAWRRTAAEADGGGLALTLLDVLANDDRAVALVRVRGRRGEKELDERQVVIFEIVGTKVTSATFVYERPDEYEAFWA